METFAVALGCLLLPSLLSAGGSAGTLDLVQSPATVREMEGGRVRMECCWRDRCRSEQVRVKWTKSNASFAENVWCLQNKSAHQSAGKRHRADFSGNCSQMTIWNAAPNDGGLYICEVFVEIPSLKKGRGTGTRVEIEARGGPAGAEGPSATALGIGVPLAVALAVAVALSSAALLCQWTRRRLLALRQGRPGFAVQECPRGPMELEEMNATMREVAEAGDRRSDSSRGSTQWCPVQLYESIDYFDLKTDASG